MTASDKKARTRAVIRRLKARFPNAGCSLNHSNALQLLVSTILSAQCTDTRVNIVTKELFTRYKTAQDFAEADPKEMAELIRSTGFYRNKTRSILAMAQALVERHGGEVPRTMDELNALAGVGRKTANVVLGNAFGIDDGMPLLGSAMDRCVSAFLEDLEDRGLSEKVLLIITGEFGRTPRINKKGGRDHWGNLCTLAFAGGGLPMGQVIGKSNRTASVPASDVVTPNQLLGTVMHTLLDIGKLRLVSGIPNDLARIIDTSQTIPQLT